MNPGLKERLYLKCMYVQCKWMFVCVGSTFLSSAVANLILIVLCSCQLRQTAYCHCPLPLTYALLSLSPSLSDCLITPRCCDSHLTSRQASASRKLDNQHPVSILSISSTHEMDMDPHMHAHTHVTTHPHPWLLCKPEVTVYSTFSC